MNSDRVRQALFSEIAKEKTIRQSQQNGQESDFVISPPEEKWQANQHIQKDEDEPTPCFEYKEM